MSRRNFHVRRLNVNDPLELADCQNALQGKPGLDPSVLSYPCTSILVATDGEHRVYMPVQTCFVLETLGYQEDIPETALAWGMKQLTSILYWEMGEKGMGEMYFIGTNEETNIFALNNGYEAVDYKVFRLRRGEPNRQSVKEGSHEDLPQSDD